MIANPPTVTIAVNGRPVGRIGVRWRGTNPPARGGEVEIYSDIERIYGKKGQQSAAAGEHFVHNFRHAQAFGRSDGTVVLRGRGGRRLWDYFQA